MELKDDGLLEKFNRAQTKRNALVIFYCTVVILLGMIGNATAVAFYGFHVKRTVTSFLLTALSLNDLVTSVILIDEIVELSHTVTFRSDAGCKIIVFTNHVFVVNSLFLLLLIGVDRYLRVRWTFSSVQLTKRTSVIAIVAIIIISVLLAIRELIFLEPVEIDINLNSNKTIIGFYCTHSDKDAYQSAITTFHLIDLTTVIFTFLAITVLYTLIGKWVLSSHKKRFSRKDNSQYKEPSTSETCASANETQPPIAEQKREQNVQVNQTRNKHPLKTKNAASLSQKSDLPKVSAARVERKLTLMIFAMTLASILSFVPYFVINLTVKPNTSTGEHELSPSIQVGLRSFMINSWVNPYIMGLFNCDFRHFVAGIFTKLCRRQNN